MKNEGLQRMFSKTARRKIMGGGFAALMLVGLSSMVDTSAAMTVQNSTTSYAGSALELLPPPPNAGCRTVGSGPFRSAQYYWQSAGPDFTYEIRLGGTYLDWGTKTYPPKTTTEYEIVGSEIRINMGEWIVGKRTDADMWVEIRTVNALGEKSDRAFHGKWKSSTYQNYSCNGGQRYDDLTIVPATPPAGVPAARPMAGTQGRMMAVPEENLLDSDALVVEADASTTPSESPSSTPSTSTPSTSATETPGTSTPDTSESSAPGNSTPDAAPTTPSETPSATVKPKLTNAVVSPSGTVTGGWSEDGASVLLVDADGVLLTGGAVDPSATLTWEGETLWIVGDKSVHRILKSPTDGLWKLFVDSGQNLPANIGGN